MKFKLTSDGSRQVHPNLDRINAYCSRWKAGTEYELEIVRRTPKKSDPQRAYYFAIVLPPFMEHDGYEPDELMLFHMFAKARYYEHQTKELEKWGLGPVTFDKRGMPRNVPSVFGKESQIPVPDKTKFVDWVIRKAAEAGVYIPSPEDA